MRSGQIPIPIFESTLFAFVLSNWKTLWTSEVGPTCRCLMCGQKNADSNKNRQSYFRAKIGRDEDGWYYGAYSKKALRKMRRTREKREWRKDIP